MPHISEAEYLRQGFLVHPYAEVVPYLWLNGRFPAGTDRHPVVLVSRDDTVAYALWKGQQDGATYRLPSSLEWEKAARGTDGRAYPWGAKWRPDASNAAPTGLNHTSPVDAFPGGRSPYGTEGMGGNVFEFTSSDDPDGRTVMKGCGWDDLPGFCRAAYQHTRAAGSRHILFGFRLVAE